MLTELQNELAKLVADEIFKYAKKAGKDTHRALKNTNLTKKGKGFPEAVLVAFESAFTDTLERSRCNEHGYAKWRHKGSEKEFNFFFCKPLIDEINNTDWASAAKNTAEGVSQVNAFGSGENYQAAICAAIVPTFEYAIGKICGRYNEVRYSNYDWRVITPVVTHLVAKEGSTEFSEERIFYLSTGDENKTKADFKLAKSLITGGFMRKPTAPSAGPYSI